MMKIKYELSEGRYDSYITTWCPYGEYAKVGSKKCSNCENRISIDYKNMIVECNREPSGYVPGGLTITEPDDENSK